MLKKCLLTLALPLLLSVSPSPSPSVSVSASPSPLPRIRVAVTLPGFADLARIVGGDGVQVTSLIHAGEDPHMSEPRGERLAGLASADLLLRAGLGLEDNWLPVALARAKNARIESGATGNLDVSTLVKVKEAPAPGSQPDLGTVHATGNPHYLLDPVNAVALVRELAARFTRLDPAHAGEYGEHQHAFAELVLEKIPEWQKQLQPFAGRPIVTYHADWAYFFEWTGLKALATLEPKAGVPPTSEHVSEVAKLMRKKKARLILTEPYFPKAVAQEVAKMAHAKLVVLPTEVGEDEKSRTYIELISNDVARLAELKP